MKASSVALLPVPSPALRQRPTLRLAVDPGSPLRATVTAQGGGDGAPYAVPFSVPILRVASPPRGRCPEMMALRARLDAAQDEARAALRGETWW